MASLPITDFIPRIRYIATAGQTDFVIPFPFFALTDPAVYRTPVNEPASDYDNLLNYVTQYTVTQNLNLTGTVTLNTPATAGDIITIVRAMPDQRLNYYLPGGSFTADAVNTDFESQVLMIQQNKMYDQIVAPHYNLTANPLQPTLLGGQDIILPVLEAEESWIKDPTNNFITTFKAGGGGALFTNIDQVAHGFVAGNVVYYDGAHYALARADSAADAEVIGIVSLVISADRFEMTTTGLVKTLSGLIPGETYFLSDTVAGALTNAEPVVAGYISKPLLIAVSATSGYFNNFRGKLIPNANTPGGLSSIISQVAHGFVAGNVVYYNGLNYLLAKADSNADAEVIGIVVNVLDANRFQMTTSGLVTELAGLLPGNTYFLSDTTAGLLTLTEPTTVGYISKPLLMAVSPTSGYFSNFRGKVIPGPNTPGAISNIINQVAHGFSVGNVVYYNGLNYLLAKADSNADAEVIGIVSKIIDADNFQMITSGRVTELLGLLPGNTYFLSDTTAGLLTLTEPTTVGYISKPLLMAISATEGYFYNFRGKVIPAEPFDWSFVVADTAMVQNRGYVPDVPAFITFHLPPVAARGSIVRIGGEGAGGWAVVNNAGQSIAFGNQITTVGVGGGIISEDAGDCIELLCVVADTKFRVLSSVGNLDVI